MAHPPPRRPRYDDGYDSYHGPSSNDRYLGSPPRRHKSDRQPRRRSPDVVPPEEGYAPRRGHPRREPLESLGPSKPAGGGGGGRRARSPSPYYASEPLPRESQRDGRLRPQHSRHERDAPRDYYDRDFNPEPKGKHRGHPHRDELPYRPRRDRAASPTDHGKRRGQNGGGDTGYRAHKSRPSSPDPRLRVRDYPPPAYAYGSEDETPHRRARPNERPRRRDMSPPRGRDREIPLRSSRPSPARRKSAPAPASAPKAGKKQWWQNPLVQAGARTAFSAGAQAAMQSRNDPSPWLGAKGAKVATAALGAALMDGFGSKSKK